jgi:VWFA-related protein
MVIMALMRVRAAISILAAVIAFAGISAAQSRRVAPTPTPTPETEKVFTEEVKLNVLAFDEDGNFFSDVKPNDLVITENNILHQPTSVRRIPASVLIVLDTGGEMRAVKNLDQTRKTASAIVNSLRPGDSVAIMDYSDKPEIVSEWTTDKTEMLKAIKRTNFGRRDVFSDALNTARDFLTRDPVENKHLVLITDGTDSSASPSAKSEAIQRLLATDISVHVISYTAMEATDIEPRTKGISKTPPPKAMPDEVAAQLPNGVRDVATAPKARTINLDRTMLRRLKARKADLETSQNQLDKLTENTNGEFIVPQTLDEMLEKAPLVAKMIDASYAVTYTPKIPLYEGKGLVERNIDVTSKRAGLIVQAKRKLVVNTSN